MQKLSEHMALSRVIRQLGIQNPDAVRLSYGLVVETIRRKNLIDKFINSQLSPRTLDELNLGVQSFLRLYVYQTRVTKNWCKIDLQEAQHIAKLGRAILGWQTLLEVEPLLGFLLTRQIKPLLDAATDEERVALETFHPTWFVKYCFDLFGRDEAIAFLKGNLNPPPTYIRLNTLRGSQETLLEKLAADGVTVEKVEHLQHAFKVVSSKRPLTRTDSFRLGNFFIQDKASCFAAETAGSKAGATVFDVCAAPGAKTTYLAQLMQNTGFIYAVDYSKRRMKTWRQEVGRMWVQIAEPVIADARAPLPFSRQADVVILDPPCTSTGVFAKLPAAKWRLNKKSIEKMAELQWQMINNCAQSVASGGTLTYNTCSITLEENELIVERFLSLHPEFSLVEIEPQIGLPGLRGLHKCQRLYPHIHQCNGFFIAKLRRQ
ncbi:MAG: SAM-dependent methyltransferase [Candidatus Bathyarchaeia archaeon]